MEESEKVIPVLLNENKEIKRRDFLENHLESFSPKNISDGKNDLVGLKIESNSTIINKAIESLSTFILSDFPAETLLIQADPKFSKIMRDYLADLVTLNSEVNLIVN